MFNARYAHTDPDIDPYRIRSRIMRGMLGQYDAYCGAILWGEVKNSIRIELCHSMITGNGFNKRETATSDLADGFTKLLGNLTIEFCLIHDFAPW